LNQQTYRNLISGSSKGITAILMRFLLRVVSVFYSAIIRTRNFLYDTKILKSKKVNAVIICIGNITTGGTGKTPLVIWLCNFLHEKNIRTAILTRGYKAHKGKFSDEPAILAKSCPDCRILVNSNRTESAQKAITELNAQMLVMDDGFQHRKLHRDLNIVTIDSTCPFGYEKILPAGLLREPATALKRAHAAVITRSDQVSQNRLNQITEKIKKFNPDIVIANAIHKPVCAKLMGLPELTLEELKNKKIFAFSGIGNPDAFLNTIKKLDLKLIELKSYNDHHNYTHQDIEDIYQRAAYLDADLILSTQKDWTKTALLMKGRDDIDFGYLLVEMDLIQGKEKITQLINNTIQSRMSDGNL